MQIYSCCGTPILSYNLHMTEQKLFSDSKEEVLGFFSDVQKSNFLTAFMKPSDMHRI